MRCKSTVGSCKVSPLNRQKRVYYIQSHNKIYVIFYSQLHFYFLRWHALIIRENIYNIRVCVNIYNGWFTGHTKRVIKHLV